MMTSLASDTAPNANQLPPLRPELTLHPGPTHRDGSPSWTLEDPLKGQFFRLGWLEMQLLSHWSAGSITTLVKQLKQQLSLAITPQEVADFIKFLRQHQLLKATDSKAQEQLTEQRRQHQQAHQQHWFKWLLKHYLFLRIPLFQPDRWLSRTQRWVRLFYTRTWAFMTLFAGLTGLILAARQWESFTHTFLYFFSLPGAFIAGLTLILVKLAHELGHAYTCKRYGGYVATMGVAFLVLWPVLYTDTSSAWRLAHRHQRLAIGAAGMLTELMIAAWATLAWSFLPDGLWRSAAFMLATTTWILTLAINLSPFMRFDGYFLLSDLINVPNLQQRAFQLARWRLREALFGWQAEPPEHFAPGLQRLLLGYAFGTWVYRFFLFLGIALLVYHFAFKLLGIALFAIEIGYFLLLPIAKECRHWYQQRQQITMNRHTFLTGSLLLLCLLGLLIPWRTQIHAPAVLEAAQAYPLYAPTNARIANLALSPGQIVQAGQPLVQFQDPALDHERQRLHRRVETLRWQSRFQRMNPDTATQLPIVLEELAVALTHLASRQQQQQALTLRAPISGQVVDVQQPLAEGDWLPAGHWLGTVITPDQAHLEAFVGERDLARLQPGDQATFYPEQWEQPPLSMALNQIESSPVSSLKRFPELASPLGGPIAARLDQQQQAIPEQALYRLHLTPTQPLKAPKQRYRGTLVIDGQPQSLIVRIWQSVAAVLIRETSF